MGPEARVLGILWYKVPEPQETTLGCRTQHTAHIVDGGREKREEKQILGSFRFWLDIWNPSSNWKCPLVPKASSTVPTSPITSRKVDPSRVWGQGGGICRPSAGKEGHQTNARHYPIYVLARSREEHATGPGHTADVWQERDTAPFSSLCEVLRFSTHIYLYMDSHADISQSRGRPHTLSTEH